MSTITPSELQRLLSQKPGLAVLDVCTPVEFTEVHVPQARNLPLAKLRPAELLAAGELQANQPVYLVCLSGARAQKAVGIFSRAGFA